MMNNKMKQSRMIKNSISLLALSVALTGGAAYAATDSVPVTAQAVSPSVSGISISVNGKAVAAGGYQKAGGKEPMLPLRAIAEALGFTLTWKQDDLSVDLSKDAIWTNVKTGEDRYAFNKMYKSLGTAPELTDNTMYVPASFFKEILRASVQAEGGSVSISSEQQQQKHATAQGVITAIREANGHQAVQMNGVGTDGLVLNVSKDTVYQDAQGTPLAFADLTLGMKVEVEHSLAATLSLPPQTPTYKITVLDKSDKQDVIGTAGTIEETRSDDKGTTSLRIKGAGLTDASPAEVILQLSDKTALTNVKGEAVDKSALAKVIGFYDSRLTRSLPPIGHAWKIVVQEAAAAE